MAHLLMVESGGGGQSKMGTKRDLKLLAAIFSLSAAVLLFLLAAEWMRGGKSTEFDEAVIKALRNPADLSDPIGPSWLESAVRDITALGSTTVLGGLCFFAAGFLWLRGQRHAFWFLCAAVLGSLLLYIPLKELYERPRPELVPSLQEVTTHSFPSGHSTLAAAVYFTVASILARLTKAWGQRLYVIGMAGVLTLLVGFSRVYLGVHYPTDVFAGWCLGSAWGILCWLTARHLQRRGQMERPSAAPPETP